jgi:hypothetical protein
MHGLIKKALIVVGKAERWIDGKPTTQVEEIIAGAHKSSRPAEDLFAKAARAAAALMDEHSFVPPEGPASVPDNFVLLISKEDEKFWDKRKQRSLEQALKASLTRRAAEILKGAGQSATDQDIKVRVKTDANVQKGLFQVDVFADVPDTVRPQEEVAQQVLAPESADQTSATLIAGDGGGAARRAKLADEGKLGGLAQPATAVDHEHTVRDDPEATVRDDSDLGWGIRPYSIEVWRDGRKVADFQFSRQTISIGRGSSTIQPELTIAGDPKVSRIHADVSVDEEGRFWLTPKGRNRTLLAGEVVPNGRKVPFKPGDDLELFSYVLRLKARGGKAAASRRKKPAATVKAKASASGRRTSAPGKKTASTRGRTGGKGTR